MVGISVIFTCLQIYITLINLYLGSFRVMHCYSADGSWAEFGGVGERQVLVKAVLKNCHVRSKNTNLAVDVN